MALTSYNGWPASKDRKAIGVNPDWEPIPGHKLPGGIKSGDVETVMTYFARQLHARVEAIDVDDIQDDWGWNFKMSANSPDLVSCHASGTAFDWNAPRHPNGKRGTFTPAQVAEIRKIQAEVGGVVRWLGDAKKTADEMHFEIDGTPDEVAAAARQLEDDMYDDKDRARDKDQDVKLDKALAILSDLNTAVRDPDSGMAAQLRAQSAAVLAAIDGLDDSGLSKADVKAAVAEALGSK